MLTASLSRFENEVYIDVRLFELVTECGIERSLLVEVDYLESAACRATDDAYRVEYETGRKDGFKNGAFLRPLLPRSNRPLFPSLSGKNV